MEDPSEDADSSSDEEEEQEEIDEEMCLDLKSIDSLPIYKASTTKIDDLLKLCKFFPEFQNQHLANTACFFKSFPG